MIQNNIFICNCLSVTLENILYCKPLVPAGEMTGYKDCSKIPYYSCRHPYHRMHESYVVFYEYHKGYPAESIEKCCTHCSDQEEYKKIITINRKSDKLEAQAYAE